MSEAKNSIPYHLLTCPYCGQSASYQFTLPRGAIYYISCRFCYKRFGVRTNMQSQIDRIIKSAEGESLSLQSQNQGEIRMKKCPQCGKELRDDANFCGSCGYKFPAAQSGNLCPNCGNPLKPGARFCGKCGTKIGGGSASGNQIQNQNQEIQASAKTDISKQASFIQWNILPGQLAVKIDSKEIASYGRVKGIVIQEGLRALFFVNGKISAELGAGSYEFKEFPDVKISDGKDDEAKKSNFISTFFNNIRNFFRNAPSLPQNVQNVSIVLVRSVEFPLVFSIKDVATSGIRSEVGLHILCKISNINDFYTNALLDKKFVSFESVKNNLEPLVKNILNSALASVAPDKVFGAQNSVLSALQSQISQVYSYIQISRIINLTAENAELENIRKLQEELYVSELELSELTKRNSFLNRLQDENNSQALREARSQTDFQAALDKIDQDKELNEDEKLKFSQMLEAQRMIREAKNQNDVDAAVQEFKKSGLLRDEEIENLKAQVSQSAALRDLNYEQSLALATLANEKELDRQKLAWEIEIGNQRAENELNLRRQQDEYSDERRRAEMNLDNEEMQSQLDLLKQAQSIRNERDEAEHKRQMESDAQKNTHEEEMRRMFQNMTAEQIVAANPDITPEAANAIAEKFKAEAAASANDKTAQMAMKQSEQMQAFMKEQMQMMRDMAVAGMNANAQNQQKMMDEKNAELNRFSSGVNNAVNAVSGALKNPATVVQTALGGTAANGKVPLGNAKSALVCPNCGTPHEEGALFCESCGASL